MLQALGRLLICVAVLIVASPLAGAQTTTGDPDAGRKADLITAYKILVNEGILDSFGHVSVRSTKDPNIFLMPRAMPPALVSLDDLLELRVSDSQPIDPKGRRVNGERYIHGEIYKARPDVISVIHSHSQAVIPLGLTAIKMRPVVAQAGFLPPETPTFEIRDARDEGDRGMQVTNSARGAALARTLSSHPAALMRGHGNVVAGSSVKQAVVYAAYIDINARMQTQALLLSRDIVTMNEPELFTPQEFDINRPWEHLKQKTLDDAARARVDRAQFGLDQTQAKQ
ncbi:MAG: class II aldolase/adducin family protein [Xanthobacteraceae bacterium]|nr:class II aldolase/adducin family protein [Xanthobacteraceae bacterium]